MEHILKTWGSAIRFLVVTTILIFLIRVAISTFFAGIDFNLDFRTDKTLVTLIDNKYVMANSVLPSCDCWAYTGIEVRPGEEIEIKVSGKIHAAADKMISNAVNDAYPEIAWIGPNGAPFRIREKEHRISDSLRHELLLNKTSNLGAVLLYFQREGDKEPNCDLGTSYFNPDSVEVYNVKTGYKRKNNDDVIWHLWATTNDILIRDFNSKENELAYLGGATGDTLTTKKKNWAVLAEKKYNRVWFDDNFGNYVIGAKIKKYDSLSWLSNLGL